MFPTEQAPLGKSRKKASGHVAKPRPKKVEQHYDDCGDSLDCLDVYAKPSIRPKAKQKPFLANNS